MEWAEIKLHGYPVFEHENGRPVRVLTYSECYAGNPILAFRIIDAQFIKLCSEVTHWVYLYEPNEEMYV